MAITDYVDFVNNYLTKNGMIGNAANINKAPDQLKLEVDELNQSIGTLGNTAVKLTGNQTIADVKTFSSNIVGNITGNAAGNSGTATKLLNARTINGVAFDGSANITVGDSTAVKLTGDQTVAGIKTFSSNIVGNITGNSGTATNASNLGGNAPGYYQQALGFTPIQQGGGAGQGTNKIHIGWQGPYLRCQIDANDFGTTFPMNINGNAATATNAVSLSTAVGSAPSYACRAWVNFNGTGTVAIRASGNVSSITDNGTGSYTVNFTTAMPDANFAIVTTSSRESTGDPGADITSSYPINSSSARVSTHNATPTAVDSLFYQVVVLR